MNKLLLSAYLAITFLLSACGGSGEDEPAPVISSFTSTKTSIMAGESVELIAVFSNGTASIDNNVGEISVDTVKTANPSETTTYTLTVTDENNATATETVTIEVVPLLIEIVKPTNTENQVVHNRVAIWVGIVSEFEISEINAFIDDVSTPLVYEASSNLYGGALFLTGMPAGKYTLEIIATDIYGGSNNQTAVITLDNPPALTTSEPINHTVAKPEIFINHSCNDDVGDNKIIIKVSEDGYDDQILTSGINQIKGSYDLSAYDGQTVKLLTECRDTSNQLVSANSTIHVESSSKLASIKSSTGQVYDYDENRLLIHNTTSTGDTLSIVAINAEGETAIEIAPDTIIDKKGTSLTPTGAIYRVEKDYFYSWQPAFYWNNSELIELGIMFKKATTSAGDYATFYHENVLWQMELSTQTNTLIVSIYSDRYSGYGFEASDIAPNGTVVFSMPRSGAFGPYSIFKFENGIRTILTPGIWVSDTDPLTDGAQFVYQKNNAYDQTTAIGLHDGNNEILLTDYHNTSLYKPASNDYYAINNSWVAYADLGNTEQTHVWSRESNGTLLQRTFFSESSLIDTLADNGEIMIIHNNKRYLSLPTGELTLIGSALGKSKYIDGTWYIAIGRSLFTVNVN